MKYYTIKSISDEGIYFLCNHWNKNRAFWIRKNNITPDKLFKTAAQAKASLTKLLKVMPEYGRDVFTVEEVII